MRMLCLRAIISLVGVVPLVLAASGCQTETRVGGMVPMTSQQVPVPSHPPPTRNKPRVATKDPADPCSVRLQDMIGPLYEYYVLHHQLPENLEDLHSVADIDVDLNFACPASGKRYIYNPVGLAAPAGGTLHLILYDATPVHNGHRWGVVAGQARNKKNELFFETFVVDLSEAVFKTYTPIPLAATEPAVASPADPTVPQSVPQVPGQSPEAPVGQP